MAAVAWVRYVGHVIAVFLLLGPARFRQQWRPVKPGLQWLRGGLMLVSTLVFFSVLKLMPLAEATALNFCAPLFVVALSPWLLGERPGRHARVSRWSGVAIATPLQRLTRALPSRPLAQQPGRQRHHEQRGTEIERGGLGQRHQRLLLKNTRVETISPPRSHCRPGFTGRHCWRKRRPEQQEDGDHMADIAHPGYRGRGGRAASARLASSVHWRKACS
ncbi:DMT family transporter [Cupriavidus basilensis]